MATTYLMMTNNDSKVYDDVFSELTGFQISETISDDCAIRYAIRISNGDWCSYKNGMWQPISEQKLQAYFVLNEGNTSAELNALKPEDFPNAGFRVVDIAAAFQSGVSSMPTIDEFLIKGKSTKDYLQEAELPMVSTEDGHGHASRIFNIEVQSTEDGGYTKLLASFQNDDGTWTEFQDYQRYLDGDHFAKAIRFRGSYGLTALGRIAKINQINIEHQGGKTTLFVGNKTTCITRYYEMPKVIHSVHLNLKHTEERDTAYHAYVAFTPEGAQEEWLPMTQDTVSKDYTDKAYVNDQFDYATEEGSTNCGSRLAVRVEIEQKSGHEDNVVLGAGTGSVTRYKLPHHAAKTSIQIFPSDASWTYDSFEDALDVTAPAGSQILASYDWSSRTTYIKSMACILNE